MVVENGRAVAEEIVSYPAHVIPLIEALDKLLTYEIEGELVRERALGSSMSFADSRQAFESIREYALRMKQLPWAELPTAPIAQAVTSVTAVDNVLQQIKSFSVEQNDPVQARNSLAQQLDSSFDALRTQTYPAIGYLSWQSVDLASIRREADAAVEHARAQAVELVQELSDRREEADKTLAALRITAATAGVSHHAEVFAATAKEHRASARNWLIATICMALMTFVGAIAIVELWHIDGDVSDAAVLQLVLAKGVLLAVGFFLTFSFGRVYRSQMHLAIISKHREDALRTFRAFAEGTEDVETKDKVLLEATRAIFATADTGLIDGGGGNETLEILDGVSALIRKH